MTRSPYTRLCFTLPYPYKGRKHENMKTCGWSVGGGGPFSVFVFSPHLREARGKTQAPAERKTTMSTTQAQQTYRVIPFRDGWCILGYQDDRYWVSDGVYTIRAWAVAQAAYQRAHPKQSDRDWFKLGAWTSPSVDAAVAEATRRMTERRAANLQRERSERRMSSTGKHDNGHPYPRQGDIELTLRNTYGDRWYVTTDSGRIVIENEPSYHGKERHEGGEQLVLTWWEMDRLARAWLAWRIGNDSAGEEQTP